MIPSISPARSSATGQLAIGCCSFQRELLMMGAGMMPSLRVRQPWLRLAIGRSTSGQSPAVLIALSHFCSLFPSANPPARCAGKVTWSRMGGCPDDLSSKRESRTVRGGDFSGCTVSVAKNIIAVSVLRQCERIYFLRPSHPSTECARRASGWRNRTPKMFAALRRFPMCSRPSFVKRTRHARGSKDMRPSMLYICIINNPTL